MRRGPAFLALLVAVLVAGCGGVSSAPAEVSGGTSTPPSSRVATPPSASPSGFVVTPATQKPSMLVGAWTVEAAGVPAGSILWISDDAAMSLALPSCWLQLDFLVSAPNLLAMSGGSGSAGCGQDLRGPAFVEATRSFAIDQDGVELVGRDGSIVARLTPGATPQDNPNTLLDESSVPTLSAAGAERMDADPPIPPSALRPASEDDLVGNWVPEATTNPNARLTFEAGGGYSAYGGSCNGQGGSWVTSEGVLLATPGFSTLAGCDNDPRPDSVPGIRTATFDGDVLVIGDRDGKVVGRFIRAA